MRRRVPLRRYGPVGVSAAVLVAAIVILTAATAHPASIGATRVHSFGALRLNVPLSWPVRRVPLHCNRYGPGVLISNLRGHVFKREVEAIPKGACSTLWKLDTTPSNFVLVDLSLMPVPSVTNAPHADSRLPPRLVRANYTAGTSNTTLCLCEYRYGFFWVNRRSYELRVWLGARASRADRRSVEALVRSVRPKKVLESSS